MTTKRRNRHSQEQIVRKLRDADAMLNTGQDLAAVLQALEVSEATYHRWRNQFGVKYTRENLVLKVSRSITSEDVIDTPEESFAMWGVPRATRSDNGPEVESTAVRDWLQRLRVEAMYIAAGSPWENARPRASTRSC